MRDWTATSSSTNCAPKTQSFFKKSTLHSSAYLRHKEPLEWGNVMQSAPKPLGPLSSLSGTWSCAAVAEVALRDALLEKTSVELHASRLAHVD